MRLALQMVPHLVSMFDAAARRLRGVRVVAGNNAHDAIVTDDPDTARTAARAGRSVLLHHWQPDALRSIEDECRSAGATLMPAHPWRFCPSVEALMQRHRDGKLGAPGLVRVHRWRDVAPTGITAEEILPDVDLVLAIFGGTPEAVYAVRATRSDAPCLQVHLGFAEGGMALIDYAWHLPQPGYDSICLIGASGAAYADDHHNMNLLLADGSIRAIRTGMGVRRSEAMLRAFLRAIAGADPHAITAAETLTALRTAEAALHAASTSTVGSPEARSA